nr:immunoglobulin heavy chain junction region [Macaca mulatta]MOW19797.1 immunoglobulin heavy chain junction region [Macaca mulatta]
CAKVAYGSILHW